MYERINFREANSKAVNMLSSASKHLSYAEIIGWELAGKVRDISIALYTKARDMADKKGIIIADTKFEFGLDPATGDIILIDEALTPDSSRFWPKDEY